MRRRFLPVSLLVLAAVLAVPSVSSAQQSLNFYLGGFSPVGEDARAPDSRRDGDVLYNDLDLLAFDVNDFRGATAGAEYLVGLGEWLDAGLGISTYRRTVPSVYATLFRSDGSDIRQDLGLRITPFTATIRFLPAGRTGAIEPYFGAGVAVFNWRYSETGNFVDLSDRSIFRENFVGKGTTTGPIVLAGLTIPVGAMGFGGEVRYQRGRGDLPLEGQFSSDYIDLGGWTYSATLRVRF